MECASKISPLTSLCVPFPSSKHLFGKSISFADKTTRLSFLKIEATSDNGAAHPSPSQLSSANAVGDMHRRLSSLESLFCYDKSVPEEIIEKPVGLSLGQKDIGNKARCPGCEAKGAILCATCSGSGLYVDSIMESQGIIVKVRCLGSENEINNITIGGLSQTLACSKKCILMEDGDEWCCCRHYGFCAPTLDACNFNCKRSVYCC